MTSRRKKVTVLCIMGLLGAMGLPIHPSADDHAGIFSTLIQPLRFIHREAVAQERVGTGGGCHTQVTCIRPSRT